MRSLTAAAILVILFPLSGCIIPLGRKVVEGHQYLKEAIAFLDSPGVTREEAIANLGLTSCENYKSKVLLYLWQSVQEWRFVPPEDNHLGIRPSTIDAREQRWALLIGYDDRGIITSHGMRLIGDASMEDACSQWAHKAHSAN